MWLLCVLEKYRYVKVRPVTPYFLLCHLFHLQITYCQKLPDSLHHVFMFLMGQEASNCANVKFWKKLGDNN